MKPDLRFGRWQDVFGDIHRVSAVVCDPPYSAKTHTGRRTGSNIHQSEIAYQSLTPEFAGEFAREWVKRDPDWLVIFGDHTSAAWWRAALEEVGLYVFGPVVWVKPDAAPRFSGDGPAMASEQITVARARRSSVFRGSLPGYHTEHAMCGTRDASQSIPGAKPLGLMRRIVTDYTDPGALVVDPFAGSGTTLRACQIEGRRSIGSEMDPTTYKKALDRINGLGPGETKTGQLNLLVEA